MTRNRPLTLTTAAAVSATILLALAACAGPASDTATPGADTNTTDTTDTTSDLPVDETARKFVACLTAKGLDARTDVGPGTPDASGKAKAPTVRNMAELRMIDRTGNPVTTDDTGTSIGTDSATQQLYTNAMFTALDYGTVWVAFKDSTALAGTPYESKQADYADCEAKHPNFSQPAQDLASGQPTYSEEDKRAALDFARKARGKGFSWVADPSGDEPTTILIPRTVTAEELRRFFRECPVGDTRISFGFDGTPEEFGYDYMKVMDEADGVDRQ
ncbi:hypothetical protein [Bifidobacterium rousetti]|uniref:hypothetical protein n=1 Tax=Bifidobacterium rousetti TaxID=2045439 RepID=UPI00168BC17A|nr:hypothetical protein [Bifidobacterium rousetti]